MRGPGEMNGRQVTISGITVSYSYPDRTFERTGYRFVSSFQPRCHRCHSIRVADYWANCGDTPDVGLIHLFYCTCRVATLTSVLRSHQKIRRPQCVVISRNNSVVVQAVSKYSRMQFLISTLSKTVRYQCLRNCDLEVVQSGWCRGPLSRTPSRRTRFLNSTALSDAQELQIIVPLRRTKL